MRNPLFTKAPADYQRDINILPHAITDAAFYIHKSTGAPMERCREWVIEQVKPGGKMAITDPRILCLSKEKAGEREQKVMPFTQYLQEIVKTGNLLAPTMAVYTNPAVKRSILSEYIAANIKKRAKAKDEKFVAMMAGNEVLEKFKDLEQTCAKLDNNGISGAHASPSTILFNKSSHSTLTSTCRCVTSAGNANNEKFIAGKRHYWCPEVTMSCMITAARHADLGRIQYAVEVYDLHIPTVDEVVACVARSTRRYWNNPHEFEKIAKFIGRLSDYERCAIMYIGDFYHLAQYNPAFVRTMLGTLATKAPTPVADPDTHVKAMDADLKALVSLLCAKELAGRDIKTTAKKDPTAYGIIGATAEYVTGVLEHYRSFISAFWVTDIIPASIATVATVVRDAVLTSDTDSTIFTVQYWTEWYTGRIGFDEESCNIAHVMAYLTSQSITHILAQMSANMGIPTESIHRLAMKNEYWFPIFTLTSRAKHYFAYQGAVEGNVKKKFDLERKGVALRNANVPIAVMERFSRLLHEVMDRVMRDGKIPLHWILDQVLEQESLIFNSINNGRTDYMKTGSIKPRDNYKDPNNATYLQYEMWKDVWGPKYGHTEPPPYACVKITLNLNNRTECENWISQFSDQQVAVALREWMVKYKRQALTNFLVPAAVVNAGGIPAEIISGINVRKLAFETLEAYYLLLEALGIYMINDNLTVLISDYHQKAA
jgi:hypothetical protein